jgi:prepilin-type N-terminal cleavage/methylation domain-containing protein
MTNHSLKGFSLIEAMIAIFILSVGILAVLFMFPLGSKTISSSRDRLIADLLAQQEIEKISVLSYGEFLVGNTIENSLPEPFSRFKRETKVVYIDPSLNLSEVLQDKGAKKIEIVVSWQDSLISGLKSVNITTIISQK